MRLKQIGGEITIMPRDNYNYICDLSCFIKITCPLKYKVDNLFEIVFIWNNES